MRHNSEIYLKLFQLRGKWGGTLVCFLLHLLSQITRERKTKVRNQVKLMIQPSFKGVVQGVGGGKDLERY